MRSILPNDRSPMNSTSKFNRIMALSLSALLCAAMIPFAGCASDQPSAPEPAAKDKPVGAAEDPGGSAQARTVDYDPSGYLKPEEKWALFEDGSLALDIVETHVFGNAAKQSLTVKLEGGAQLTGDVSVGDVTLTGGLSAWKPTSIEVASPTEFTVVAELAEGQTPSAVTAVAGVEIAAACVTLPAPDTSEIDAHMDEMIASDPDAELAEDIERDASADAGAPTSQTQSQPVANSLVSMAYADEPDVADASPYEAAIPFVHPSMQVDVNDTAVADGKTTYRIVSCEFSFPETISADDFSINLADGAPEGIAAPALESVKRLGDFEIEVVVADDASAASSPCDWAALHLDAQASGTGGEVACPLTLPDAWIDSRVTEVNDEPIEQIAAGANSTEDESSAASSSSGSSDAVSTVTVNAALHNTDADASALEVNALCADGIYRNVAGAAVEDLENGRVDITVDTQALASLVATNEAPSDSASPDEETAGNVALAQDAAADGFAILSIDAGEIALAYGGAVDPEASMIYVPLTANCLDEIILPNSCSIAEVIPEAPKTSGVDLLELAKGGAKSLLGGIAGATWSYVRSTWLVNTPLGEHTINELYNNILKLQTDLSNIASTLDVLVDKESAHYNANIVNAANAKIARIQSEYALIGGLYKQVVAAEGDEAATQVAIDNLMAAKKTTIDNLIVDMGELYNTIKVADAATGASLIKVYDGMAMLSYNWGSAAAPGRQSYRDAISEVWLGCTTMLYVICGAPQYQDEYSVSLTNLENMTKEVNDLLDKNPVNAGDYERAADTWTLKKGNTFVKAEGKAYFCYTTNEWYAMCPGSTSTNGWDKAFFTTKKVGRTYKHTSTSPFISWDNGGSSPSWGSFYLTTAQGKSMVARLGTGRSLLGELSSFYSLGDVKRLVTDSSYSMKAGDMYHNASNWYFDTYEYGADKVSTTFTSHKLHFEGDVYQPVFKKAKKTTVSSTSANSMMAIARVDVK